MRRLCTTICLFVHLFASAQQADSSTPDKIYGQLFRDVQLARVFDDSKTFVDCIPLLPPAEIVTRYMAEKQLPSFSLREFVRKHFRQPTLHTPAVKPEKDLRKHIAALWDVLTRDADTAVTGSSLIPLPHPYIVPGGRFREVYYWDSYFTMLGLKESGRYDLIENMVKNFAWLIRQYGHIPNGNRSYYLSRSQPPFFSLMVDLLATVKGRGVYLEYEDEMQLEMEYWYDLNIPGPRQVELPDAEGKLEIFSLYRDDLSIPRQESYREDDSTAAAAALAFRRVVLVSDTNRLKQLSDSVYAATCHNLRSAAASGWDFSSRWMRSDQLHSTSTSTIVPVDLNCLIMHLYHSRMQVLNIYDTSFFQSRMMLDFDSLMKKVYRNRFFNTRLGWYCDYDLQTGRVMDNPTLAGMFPLFFKMADKKDVPRIVAFLKKHFLKPGGVVTSLKNTGQQWDAPNGWAPLQWVTIIGLENYGYHDLAKEIASRWVRLNKNVFRKTGRLMEKYDVVNLNRPAGGGEYPSQDGFGWTNGVLLALMNKYHL